MTGAGPGRCVDVVVRAALADDLPGVRTVLALAYHDNPLIRWVLPDPATRDAACAAWIGPSLDRYLAVGRIDVLVGPGGEVLGAAVWRAPGPVPDHPVLRTVPSGPAVLAALVGEDRAGVVLGALARVGREAPDGEAAYLNYLAVDPAFQGRGWGGRVVGAGIAAYDAGGVPTWLATSDPRNVTFYERLGFRVRARAALDTDPHAGAPTLAVLHRDAAARVGGEA